MRLFGAQFHGLNGWHEFSAPIHDDQRHQQQQQDAQHQQAAFGTVRTATPKHVARRAGAQIVPCTTIPLSAVP